MYFLPPPLRLEWDHHMRHLPRPSQDFNTLLDVGCGNGDFLLRASQAGWHGTGVDFDPAACRAARSRGLTVLHGGLEAADQLGRQFDVITANQVIEHVHDPVDFLQSCWRLLRPRGQLWIGTPNMAAPLHKKYGRYWQMWDVPRHLSILSPHSARLLFSQAGIPRPELKRRGWSIPWIMQDCDNLKAGAFSGFVERVSFANLLRGALEETLAYTFPVRHPEMVVIARKPHE